MQKVKRENVVVCERLKKKKWSVVREPALSTMFCLMSVRMWQKENIEGEFEKQEANLTCPLPEIFWQ